MPPEHWPSCGRSPPAAKPQRTLRTIVEGCRGSALRGAVLFRAAMKPILTAISTMSTTAQAAMVLHDFGLPAIMTKLRCRFGLFRYQLFLRYECNPKWQCGLSVPSLDSLAQCVDAFGAPLHGGLAGAGIACGDCLFAAFAQAALESIPAATDSDGTVANYD